MDSCRPSIDSALSVSRIGSNAQCKSIKIISVGSKNDKINKNYSCFIFERPNEKVLLIITFRIGKETKVKTD